LNSGVRIGLGLLGLGADGHHGVTVWCGGPGTRARPPGNTRAPSGWNVGGERDAGSFLAHVEDPLFVVAGGGKHDALHALTAQDPQLTAWRAVQGCAQVELWWTEADAR